MRCGRCDSGDLVYSDANDGTNSIYLYRIICLTCGWVTLKDELEGERL